MTRNTEFAPSWRDNVSFPIAVNFNDEQDYFKIRTKIAHGNSKKSLVYRCLFMSIREGFREMLSE